VKPSQQIFFNPEGVYFCDEGSRSRCYGLTAALKLIVQPCGEDDQFFSFFQVMAHRWNEIDRGNPKYSGKKTCPSATLSTKISTWTDPGSNPGLRGGRPATNRLSHGTANPEELMHNHFRYIPVIPHFALLCCQNLTCAPLSTSTKHKIY
jgi:hypothetical protein